MRLIGLHGRAHAGKDTIANLLVRHHNFSRLAFAGPIKDGLIAMLGLSREDLDGADKERPLTRFGISPRRLMQTLGTEWGRDLIRPDLWIRVAEPRLAQMRKYSSAVVITDVRFANEAAWIRSQGGEIWHVMRPQPENVVALHASEDGIPIELGIDGVIDNGAGLEHLADEVRAALAGERVLQA